MRAWAVRTTALAAACLALAVAAGAHEVKDEVGRFSAVFPVKPIEAKDEGFSDLGPHVHLNWVVEQESGTFAVIVTEYSQPIAKVYDQRIKALTNRGASLKKHAVISVSGVDGREVFTELPTNEVLRQRMIVVGNRLYQVIYQGQFGTESRPEVEAFMTSFQLLK